MREEKEPWDVLLMGQSRPNWAVGTMSGLTSPATELRTSLVVRFVPIVLKNSKIAVLRKSRKCSALRFLPLQGTVESIRVQAIAFAVIHVVPHIAARETRQRS
jgi:hypothetical protein